MDVSYDCELNLSTNLETTSFEEFSAHDELKEAMHNEYNVFIKDGMWNLVDPPFGCKWAYNDRYK